MVKCASALARMKLCAGLTLKCTKQQLKKRVAGPIEMKGRQYKVYVFVSEEGMKSKEDFDYWIKLSLDFNKKAKASNKKSKRHNET